MTHRPLSPRDFPRPLTVPSAVSGNLIADAFEELRRKALRDVDKCCGYFPGMIGVSGIDHDLPASRRLAVSWPAIDVDVGVLSFNFVRLSLVRQRGPSPFHLDSDASTALTGSVSTLFERLVWRLLVNLSPDCCRTLSFVNVETSSVSLVKSRGYVHCGEQIPAGAIETMTIPPREKARLHGLLFPANRVLHSGRDDDGGHYVMAFGREESWS